MRRPDRRLWSAAPALACLALLFVAPAPLPAAQPDLTADLSVTLVGGVIRDAAPAGTDVPPAGLADVLLDFECRQGKWSPEVWGYAPGYNRRDHVGSLAASSAAGDDVRLEVRLTVEPVPPPPRGPSMPGPRFAPRSPREAPGRLRPPTEAPAAPPAPAAPAPGGKEARYTIHLKRSGDALEGTYAGTFGGRDVKGRAFGTVRPPWPRPVEGHVPLAPGEHPRLIFRKSDLAAIRERAETDHGKAILARLDDLLTPVKVMGPNRTLQAGYCAAGHGLRGLVRQNAAEAAQAQRMVRREILNFPGEPLLPMLERAPRLLGTALAYDLCYDAWDAAFRKEVADYLLEQARQFIYLSEAAYAAPWDPSHVIARGSAGMAALAVLGDPEAGPDAARIAAQCERSMKRYLAETVGDRGWASGGDANRLLAFSGGLYPFCQALGQAAGRDLVSGSAVGWNLPLLVMKTIPGRGMPTSGPASNNVQTSGQFPMGFPTVPEEYRRAVLWTFNTLGDERDIILPHHAAYALANLPADLQPQDPAEVLGRAFRDGAKGYFVFRNQWKDATDIVAALDARENMTRGAGDYEGVASFRLWGLAGRWAIRNRIWAGENTVLVPAYDASGRGKVTHFAARPDASAVVTVDLSGAYRVDEEKKRALTDPGRQGQPPKYKPEDFRPVTGLRSFAVDYSGACGAPALVVVVDRLAGGLPEPKTWRMYFDGRAAYKGRAVTLRGPERRPTGAAWETGLFAEGPDPDVTLQVTFVAPAGVAFPNTVQSESEQKEGRQPRGITGEIGAAGGDEFFVVMTLQKGKPPDVKVEGEGLAARVTVGGRTIAFDGAKIVLGP